MKILANTEQLEMYYTSQSKDLQLRLEKFPSYITSRREIDKLMAIDLKKIEYYTASPLYPNNEEIIYIKTMKKKYETIQGTIEWDRLMESINAVNKFNNVKEQLNEDMIKILEKYYINLHQSLIDMNRCNAFHSDWEQFQQEYGAKMYLYDLVEIIRRQMSELNNYIKENPDKLKRNIFWRVAR